MERSTLAIRLDRNLIEGLDERAKAAGLTRCAHLTAIIESSLQGNSSGSVCSSSEGSLRRRRELLQLLRGLTADVDRLIQVVARMEREAALQGN